MTKEVNQEQVKHMIEENLEGYAESQIDKALSYSEGIRQGYIQAKEFEGELWIKATHYHIQKQEQGEPVAMLERDPSIGRLRVTYEDAVTELAEGVYPLYIRPQGWRDNVAQAYLKGFDDASVPLIKAKERLIRIMGTFDLATGHGNTMEELLDSLESELRDVLGHYREALKQEQGGCAECNIGDGHALYCVSCAEKFIVEYAGNGTVGIQNETKPTGYFFQMPKQEQGEPVAWKTDDIELYVREDKFGFYDIPLYTHPPQRTWIGLLDDEKEHIEIAGGKADLTLAEKIEAILKERNT